MNARCPRDGIHLKNWEHKKKRLMELMKVLENTDKFIKLKHLSMSRPEDRSECHYQGVIRPEYPPPFISQETIKSLRITIKSITELVELLLASPFDLKYVLTGKFNQDCLEVILSITIRFKRFSV